MGDAAMGLMIVVFFAVCIAYVTWCDRIIGPDVDEPALDTATTDDPATVGS